MFARRPNDPRANVLANETSLFHGSNDVERPFPAKRTNDVSKRNVEKEKKKKKKRGAKISKEKYAESMREERIFQGWFLSPVSKWRIQR